MTSLKKILRNLLITARPHFFVVSGSAGLAGMAVAYADPPIWITFSAFIVCFFSYGLIQTLCDTFDIETDKINAPFRPMVSGELSKRTVWITLGFLLSIVAVLFYFINPILLYLQGTALLFSFTYNRMKRLTHIGPIWNGIIIAALPLIGAIAVSNINSFSELPIIIYIISFFFCFVYAGFVLTGYFKDVTGDAQTGYNTAPVKYTPNKAKWHVLPYTLLAFIGILFFIYFNQDQWHSMNDITRLIYIFSSLVSVSFILYSNILLIKDPSEKASYHALVWYTRGMLIYFLVPVYFGALGIAIITTVFFIITLEYTMSFTKGTGQA